MQNFATVVSLETSNVSPFFKARHPSEVPPAVKGSCVVLGNLDGLHLGHQQLIRQALQWAKPRGLPSVVFTFDPHPMEVLPGRPDFKRILPVAAQTELLEKLQVQGVYYQNFNLQFAAQTAEQFLTDILMPTLKPQAIVVGFNFCFGKDRQGTPEFLQQWGLKNGVHIIVVPPFEVGAVLVSSSLIRKALLIGDVEKAQALLGFPFFVDGVVERGAQRGRGMGFPTANVHWSSTLVPAFGVYVTQTYWQGRVFPSVSHLGPVPTFGEERLRLETHVLDQQLSLYGEKIRAEFLCMLRPPVKFSGVEELKAQIQKDILAARAYHQKL